MTAKQENAAEECDGKCGSCSTSESCNDQKKQQYEQEQRLKLKLSKIKHKIAIISGKGGVGKSTVAVNVAVALAKSGAKVGLLDADIYGPNVPTMMGVTRLPMPENNKLVPAEAYGVKVMSIGFLVKPGQALIWRGPPRSWPLALRAQV